MSADQAGRTAVVTGTSIGGLGHVTALELARRGARVVLAGRSDDKLRASERAVLADVPGVDLVRLQVDLSSLASVRAAAARASDLGPIHVLVNNAGVARSSRRRTAEGLDLMLATNHYGPFLLTGLLLPQLVDSGDGRVVTVSSLFHRVGWSAYGRSKLDNLLFTMELDLRARRGGLPVKALAAHPGFAGTHLAGSSILEAAIRGVSQSVQAGALPSLMAATEDLPGGTFCGPGGLGELSGAPQVVTASAAAQDEVAARRLWEHSEGVTGVTYP